MTVVQPTLQTPSKPDVKQLLDQQSLETKKSLNCVRVGVVQSFNPENQTAVVKIAQQQITSIKPDGTRTLAAFPLLLDIPVYFPAGGGFTLTFPVAAGDECIILFNDRELDNWLTNGPGFATTTLRVHDLSDAMCLVGLRSFPRSLADVSADTTQLRSDDGSTYVEIAGGQVVNVVAPGGCTIRGAVTIIGNIDIQGDGGGDTATIDCNLTQTPGKVLKAGNGATGTFSTVTVADGIVTGGTP